MNIICNSYKLLILGLVLTLGTLMVGGCGTGVTQSATAPTQQAPINLANPASVYCQERGYTLELRTDARGSYGVCLFPDGSECEEWAFFRGECRPDLGADSPLPGPVNVPDPTRARQAVLDYIWQHHDRAAPAPGTTWVEENITPEGLVGSSVYRYTAKDWTITVSYPIVAPEAVVYQVTLTSQVPRLCWEGTVDATGQVTELGAPAPAPAPAETWAESVEDWTGVIVSNPPGSQFDDYFEWQSFEGGQYGIESLDPNLQAQLASLRDTGQTVRIWGTLYHNVPDYNATQIQVTRIAVQQPPAPLPVTEEQVEGWIGTIGRFPPGAQLKDYFQRDDGQGFGIWGATDAAKKHIEMHQWTGAQVQVWGKLISGIPDFENRQIQVERIEAVSGPSPQSRNLSPFATPSASSALPSDRWGTYHAWSAIDGLLSTPWAEGAAGPGVGEWIMLTFPGTIEVGEIGLDVGYDRDANDTFRSPEVFAANNRIRRATLVFSNGEQLILDFADARGVQRIPLARAPAPSIETTYVKVIIDEVYPGATYDDTCLAEVEVWGITK
jgi:putative hemolysin